MERGFGEGTGKATRRERMEREGVKRGKGELQEERRGRVWRGKREGYRKREERGFEEGKRRTKGREEREGFEREKGELQEERRRERATRIGRGEGESEIGREEEESKKVFR